MPRRLEDSQSLKSIYRLLDANLNRCREGLRVLEDSARFVYGDGGFFRAFRRERHKIDLLTRRLCPDIVSARNSLEDEGRTIRESGRPNLGGLISANFRRCEESLRVLEEYGKLFSPRAGAEFKEIRYAAYQLEKLTMKKWKMPR